MGSFWKLVGFANTYGTGFFAYLAVACVSVAVEWSTFAIAVTMLTPIEAAVAGFVSATAVNFVLSRTYVFRSRALWQSELAFVTLASAIVFIGNLAVFYVLYDSLGAHVMVAKMAGTGAGFMLNYAVRQFLIFSSIPRYAPLSSRLAGQALRAAEDERSSAIRGNADSRGEPRSTCP
jgi:putative flippase GtrA